MSDFKCPYCGADHEVCHDDGFGYDEDKAHEDTCRACGKNFVFYTSISFDYRPKKADCLNGEPHVLETSISHPRKYSRMRCRNCDHYRLATAEEIAEFYKEEQS
jgi:transcription elongation factor Elf1